MMEVELRTSNEVELEVAELKVTGMTLILSTSWLFDICVGLPNTSKFTFRHIRKYITWLKWITG